MSDKLFKSYESLINKLIITDDSSDNEAAHIIQDKLYRKFIRDIVNNKFNSIDDIKNIANELNKKVVKNDKGRYYA